MNIIVHTLNGNMIAEVESNEIILSNLQSGLDLIANISYQNIVRIILYERNITEDFFSLKTCLAGDILQKCVNYGIKIAIVGDFEKYESKSLRSFIIECNRGNQFFFVKDIVEAIERLSKAN